MTEIIEFDNRDKPKFWSFRSNQDSDENNKVETSAIEGFATNEELSIEKMLEEIEPVVLDSLEA